MEDMDDKKRPDKPCYMFQDRSLCCWKRACKDCEHDSFKVIKGGGA